MLGQVAEPSQHILDPARSSAVPRTACIELGESASLAQQEQELLARMFACDAAAWRDFRRRYDRLIVATIARVTRTFPGVVSQADGDDVYCELLLALSSNGFQKLRSFQPARGVRLSTWVGLLATRATWDYLRRVKRRLALCRELSSQDRPDDPSDALANLLEREQHDVMFEALQRLSTRDKGLIQMLFVEGRSPEEAAVELGISVKTVYTKKHKIIVRLSGLVRGY